MVIEDWDVNETDTEDESEPIFSAAELFQTQTPVKDAPAKEDEPHKHDRPSEPKEPTKDAPAKDTPAADAPINDERTKKILDIFDRTQHPDKAALNDQEKKQLKELEKSFATGDLEKMKQLLKDLNAADKDSAQRILDAFHWDLYGLGIQNSVSGDSTKGWSLNMQNPVGDTGWSQQLTISPDGKTNAEYVKDPDSSRDTPKPTAALPKPIDLLKTLRQPPGRR